MTTESGWNDMDKLNLIIICFNVKKGDCERLVKNAGMPSRYVHLKCLLFWGFFFLLHKSSILLISSNASYIKHNASLCWEEWLMSERATQKGPSCVLKIACQLSLNECYGMHYIKIYGLVNSLFLCMYIQFSGKTWKHLVVLVFPESGCIIQASLYIPNPDADCSPDQFPCKWQKMMTSSWTYHRTEDVWVDRAGAPSSRPGALWSLWEGPEEEKTSQGRQVNIY